MPKRMTDTDKWKKSFFKSLPIEYKMFWLYVLDDCDHAGVWQVDIEVAQIRLGTKLSIEKAQGFFKDRVVALDDGTKWFVPDFIQFQYGSFNQKNNMYKSIMPIIEKYDLTRFLTPFKGGIETVPVKVKEEVKELKTEISLAVKEGDKNDFLTNQRWKEEFCMAKNLTIEELESIQIEWLKDLSLRKKIPEDYKTYFLYWYNKVLPKANLNSGTGKQMHL